jgi:adenosylmethionine-8-amino-7-oxononanoate aminotransferase
VNQEDKVFWFDLTHSMKPLSHGEGVYLYDTDGKQYLDGASSVVVTNIGHGNKRVAQAMAEQAAKVAYAPHHVFSNAPVIELAERLSRFTPANLNYCQFVSGGSEANESAIKLARAYFIERGQPEKWKIIGRWNSYHGNTLGALSANGHRGRRAPYLPMLLDFPHIPAAYCYRCPLNLEYPSCQVACAKSLEETILAEGPETVAAFIAEPLVGAAAAAITPPAEYFGMIREICDKYDILFICDEVMTGVGRTGRNFAIEHWNVIPDILVTAKGLSGGYAPLGAIAVREEIFEAFVPPRGSGQFIHGFTYSGHPLSCAVANEVLKIWEEAGLTANAAELGSYLRQGLEELQTRHPIVGDVRGLGFMQGMEFVQNRETKEPFPPNLRVARQVCDAALEEGLVVYPGTGAVDGVAGDHILVTPPLIITREQIDELLQKLDRALSRVEQAVLPQVAI